MYRILVVLGQRRCTGGDIAGDRQANDAGGRQGALNPLKGRYWELDPGALFQQHDLPTGNTRDRNHVGPPDRGDHGLRQVCPRANDPPKPDMGVEDNQRSASQSSGSLAGEMMSPRIRPLPAMSGGGWRFGEAGGSSRTENGLHPDTWGKRRQIDDLSMLGRLDDQPCRLHVG